MTVARWQLSGTTERRRHMKSPWHEVDMAMLRTKCGMPLNMAKRDIEVGTAFTKVTCASCDRNLRKKK